jgi:hypothetical protein
MWPLCCHQLLVSQSECSAMSRKPLRNEVHKSIALMKLSGTLLVAFRKGKYFACGKLALLISVLFCFLCSTQDLPILFEEVFMQEQFTAAHFLQSIAKLFYHLVLLNFYFIQFFKTKKMAGLLNIILQVDNLMLFKYSSLSFILSSISLTSTILVNMIVSYTSKNLSVALIFSDLYMEFYLSASTINVLLFAHLIFSINRNLNKNIIICEPDINFTTKLRIVRNIMNEAVDEFQRLFGFAIFLVIFDRALYFMQDINELFEIGIYFVCFHSLKNKTIFSVMYNASWAFLDLTLVLAIVVSCARIEVEVRF